MAEENEPRPARPELYELPGLVPRPDPTILTTELIDRAIRAEREYIDSQLAIRDERFKGIDEATRLRLKQILSLPESVVRHERELTDQQFTAVAQRFDGLETRSDKVESLNKIALDAAFAAQKEAAAKQDEANQKAIDKSERATNESIAKLGFTVEAANKALSDKIDDLKTRVGIIDATLVGQFQNAAGGKDATSASRATIGFAISIGLFFVSIAGIAIALIAAGH